MIDPRTKEEGRARCAMEEPQRDWAAARRSHDGGAVAGRNRCRERNGSAGDDTSDASSSAGNGGVEALVGERSRDQVSIKHFSVYAMNEDLPRTLKHLVGKHLVFGNAELW